MDKKQERFSKVFYSMKFLIMRLAQMETNDVDFDKLDTLITEANKYLAVELVLPPGMNFTNVENTSKTGLVPSPVIDMVNRMKKPEGPPNRLVREGLFGSKVKPKK